ncbi:MAG: hypothetical protein H7A35_07450 [Planctomycetales bacterium]|nr:hypothetical protein [bacterium]UNM09886.1 MAG: hypothetical protein H7A35_07450 [Planctomycetales bacterium]
MFRYTALLLLAVLVMPVAGQAQTSGSASPPVICSIDGIPICEEVCGTLCIEASACDEDGIASMTIELDGVVVASAEDGWISYDLDLGGLSIMPHYLMVIVEDESGDETFGGIEFIPVGPGTAFMPKPIESGRCKVLGMVMEDNSGDELPDVPRGGARVGLYRADGTLYMSTTTLDSGAFRFLGVSCLQSLTLKPILEETLTPETWHPMSTTVGPYMDGVFDAGVIVVSTH